MTTSNRLACTVFLCLCVTSLDAQPRATPAFVSAFATTPDRPWIGPDYWANPLQGWRVRDGLLECVKAGPTRTLHLLTRDLSARSGTATVDVSVASFEPSTDKDAKPWVGVRLAARGRFSDYRDNAVYGTGIEGGVRADGTVFAGDTVSATPVPVGRVHAMRATLAPSGAGFALTVVVRDAAGLELGMVTSAPIDAASAQGNIALACSDASCAFREWRVTGSKVDQHRDRAWGPILFTQYTLSRRVMKLTAQLAPISTHEAAEARLSVLVSGNAASGVWRPVAASPIEPLARTATFRVADWDDTRDHTYRVSLTHTTGGRPATASFDGTIRRDPRDKPQIVVAAFTGNNDLGFPHADLVTHVSTFKPDVLVFTGDQIYEPVGGFGVQRSPLDMATLDYLRKWYIFGWEYRELLRHIPSVALPDDHDVYHGNVWGAGGRDANDIAPALQREGVGAQTQKQDSGGYTMPADWVNMVQRTQTSHLPDPVDPAPVEQGITVYFTEFVWGGVSFAILEDRKWKSPPAVVLPDAQIVNGWARNPRWDSSKTGDVPGAELLGPRQMAFLERWAGDWAGGIWMKSVISQTIFANVATLPRGSRADDITTRLPIQLPGGYAEGETPVQDHDSNAWPQTPRLAALRLMRKARALHIAGDQHLGSTIQYGIDTFRDGPYAICVPSVANFWPRRWFPDREGANRAPGSPRNTGDYLDGFGNKMTVFAVSNPFRYGIDPADINDRAPGYGIISFDRTTRRITMANWPRWVDPAAPGAKPYPGWPITIVQDDK